MFALHWSTLSFGLVVLYSWFAPSNNPVKHTFSFICIP
jgi:hypothetical protein